MLDLPGDYYEFTVDAVNDGTIDAMIDSIIKTPELTDEQKKYFNYIIIYQGGDEIKSKQIVKSEDYVRIKVRVEYRIDITEIDLPTTTETLNLGFSLNYIQADSSVGSAIKNHGHFGVNGDINEFGTIVTTTENEEEIEQDVEESFNTVESFGDMDSFGTVGPEETVEEKSISDDILSEEIEDSFDTVDTFDAETSVENVIENDIVTTNDQIDFEEQIVDSSDEIVDNSVENLKTETKTEINSDLKVILNLFFCTWINC
jgi:hypothetical protein